MSTATRDYFLADDRAVSGSQGMYVFRIYNMSTATRDYFLADDRAVSGSQGKSKVIA
jgi:hypothetical protein